MLVALYEESTKNIIMTIVNYTVTNIEQQVTMWSIEGCFFYDLYIVLCCVYV
jgi:hypothetical protein